MSRLNVLRLVKRGGWASSFSLPPAARIWLVFVLGRRFSGLVAIQPGHTLVTNGVYGVVRNPSYLGLLISSPGWALASRAGVGVLLTALLVPPLLARIRAEEASTGLVVAVPSLTTPNPSGAGRL